VAVVVCVVDTSVETIGANVSEKNILVLGFAAFIYDISEC